MDSARRRAARRARGGGSTSRRRRPASVGTGGRAGRDGPEGGATRARRPARAAGYHHRSSQQRHHSARRAQPPAGGQHRGAPDVGPHQRPVGDARPAAPLVEGGGRERRTGRPARLPSQPGRPGTGPHPAGDARHSGPRRHDYVDPHHGHPHRRQHHRHAQLRPLERQRQQLLVGHPVARRALSRRRLPRHVEALGEPARRPRVLEERLHLPPRPAREDHDVHLHGRAGHVSHRLRQEPHPPEQGPRLLFGSERPWPVRLPRFRPESHAPDPS